MGAIVRAWKGTDPDEVRRRNMTHAEKATAEAVQHTRLRVHGVGVVAEDIMMTLMSVNSTRRSMGDGDPVLEMMFMRVQSQAVVQTDKEQLHLYDRPPQL